MAFHSPCLPTEGHLQLLVQQQHLLKQITMFTSQACKLWLLTISVFTTWRYGTSRWLVSVHLSVHLSHSCIVLTWLKLLSHFFLSLVAPIILVVLSPSSITPFQGNPFIGGAKYTGVGKIWLSTKIAIYLLNGTRRAHSCNATLIGSHR